MSKFRVVKIGIISLLDTLSSSHIHIMKAFFKSLGSLVVQGERACLCCGFLLCKDTHTCTCVYHLSGPFLIRVTVFGNKQQVFNHTSQFFLPRSFFSLSFSHLHLTNPLRDTGYIIYILLCCDSSLYVSGCLCFISERSPHSWDRDVCNLLSICLFTVFSLCR